MRARALIDGASFGPDALKVVGQAYDLAWAKISHDFAGGPVVRGSPARPGDLHFSVASEDCRDVESSRTQGLRPWPSATMGQLRSYPL
jgi:hypothetical protein